MSSPENNNNGDAKGVLVLGGGIAGIQASLDLADSGVQVYLVEKGPSLGGKMAQLDKTFPTNDCSMCIISPKLVAATRHPNIKLFTHSELQSLEGSAGDFKATILQRSRFVDMDKCVGCGACAEKCPSKVPNEFDEGVAFRKAIYIPFPQAAPLKYSIDKENCLYFKMLKKGKEGACMLCVKACEADAVDHKMEEEEVALRVGSVIVATGYDLIDPGVRPEYGYEKFDNVITGIELERYLSASGPTEGHLVRPSDGTTPKRMAFIQCYGSRDEHYGCQYCSRICCMYAIKEAMISKEHEPGLEDITIYYMDVRSYGKGYEEYFERAKNELGVNFNRGRPAQLMEDPETREIIIVSEDTHTGKKNRDRADLVILSSAVVPQKGTSELAQRLGIELGPDGFFKEKHSNSQAIESTKEGIYICGCAQGPKDIPDSVAQASGAAAKAGKWVKDDRLPEREVDVEPIDVSGEARVGVFICHCGNNIAGVVDMETVTEFAKTLPNVVHADHYLYTCSDNTQKDIQNEIKEKGLTRVVVAACSPTTHEPIFKETLEEIGLNPYLFEMANIRNQDSWIHMHEPELATEKAKDLVASAVAKSALLEPLTTNVIDVTKTAMVIGGGIAGIGAALDLSAQGFDVHLIEKQPFIGGSLARKDILAPAFDKAGDILEDQYAKLKDSNVTIHTNNYIDAFSGFIGNFKVSTTEMPTGVDPQTCTNCGECSKVCPVDVVDDATGFVARKAIWTLANGFPKTYAVDFENCTKCGECVKACKSSSIDLEAAGGVQTKEIDVGSLIVAIGSKLYTPQEGEFGYKQHPGVITNDELETILMEKGEDEPLTIGGKEAKRVAMIHCVGSRDADAGFAGCSRYCCQVALKQAVELRELGVDVVDYYRDIRSFGKGGERLYQRSRDSGVLFFRFTPETAPEVKVDGDSIKILAHDTLLGKRVELSFDAIVLSVGMRAYREDARHMQDLTKIPMGGDGFFLERHPKLAPVETNTDGIFISGCAQYPKDVGDSMAQSSAAAAKSAIPLAVGKVMSESIPSVVNKDLCTGCGTCEIVCPYGAITFDDEGKAEVVEVLCKGCGTCRAACPERAIKAPHFTLEELLAQINAIVEGVE